MLIEIVWIKNMIQKPPSCCEINYVKIVLYFILMKSCFNG